MIGHYDIAMNFISIFIPYIIKPFINQLAIIDAGKNAFPAKYRESYEIGFIGDEWRFISYGHSFYSRQVTLSLPAESPDGRFCRNAKKYFFRIFLMFTTTCGNM